MTDPTLPAFLEPKWFFPAFAAMWVGVTGLLAHLSGWATLAARFPSDDPVDGQRFRFASGSLGWRWVPVHYGNGLFVTVSPTGLRLSLFLPFRFLSPPLFVPWTAVESLMRKRIVFVTFTTLVLKGAWPRITLRGSSAQPLYQACSTARPDLTHAP